MTGAAGMRVALRMTSFAIKKARTGVMVISEKKEIIRLILT
jgi:hypothetical protein